MVKQGFLNLPDEERQRILNAALDEFAASDYDAASFNRIIQNAGISKGSMYHYFHNKEDLYVYLIELVMDEKKNFLAEKVTGLERPVNEHDFFDLLALQLNMAAQFGRANPRFHAISMNLQKMPDNELKDKIWGRFNTEFQLYIEGMVDKAMQERQLRVDFDQNFIIRLLGFFLLNFTQLYPDARQLHDSSAETLAQEMSQLVDFLRCGLQGKKKEVF